MREQENIKIVQDLYNNFRQGDFMSLMAALDNQVEWREPENGPAPFKGTYRGKREVGEYFRQLALTVQVERFEPRSYMAQSDTVIALGSYRFKSKRTGEIWQTDWAMVWQFRGDKVARYQVYKDTAAELVAMRGW